MRSKSGVFSLSIRNLTLPWRFFTRKFVAGVGALLRAILARALVLSRSGVDKSARYLVLLLFGTSLWSWNTGAVQIQSSWSAQAGQFGRVISPGDWVAARSALRLDHGWILAQNDATNLYLLVDLITDQHDDPPGSEPGDGITLAFDVNCDHLITPKVDLLFSLFPRTTKTCVRTYISPKGILTKPNPTATRILPGFGPGITDGPAHRLWQVIIPLAEIRAKPGQHVCLGVSVSSVQPRFEEQFPPKFETDFSSFIEIALAAEVEIKNPALTATGGPIASVKPDGALEKRLPDGTVILRRPGSITTIRPDGTAMTVAMVQVPPLRLPSPPEGPELRWLQSLNDSLLETIAVLVGKDQAIVQNYLNNEPADADLHQKIALRSNAINFMVAP